MYNFKDKLRQNAGKTKPKENNSVPNAKVLPFPELTPEEKDKLAFMFDALIGLSGRLYSTLSINEKRLVEMFCKRYQVTSKGNAHKEGEKAFTVLKISAYAHRFLVYGLQMEYFTIPPFKSFHIFENERMNIDDLYGDTYKYSGSPFHDALRSYPTSYLPVRASQGKASIFAVYSGSKASDLETYIFKERKSVLPDEALYNNPLLPEKEPEKIDVTPPIPSDSQYLIYEKQVKLSLEIGLVTPLAAAFINRYLEIPNEFHTRYNTNIQITDELIALAKDTPTDTEAYQKAYQELL
ncbi:hypothetical protein [Escherichia phage EC104]|uniref:hypothetical protein n=1 Tax=Escherichia phage EC100 TaxID=2894397 RepID=UPI00218818DF|nr:hypothetical protein [Escherichia phage EC100]URF91602.1 hypothetical protein [Escherichia phage EC122]URN70627.1 hypothetical protein [Escherichia phage EC104]URN70782.1 hypothetical protein [Escherichia phage EC105]URN70948.1 hypothetical protein [Escherichia phage EC142]